MFKIDDIVEWSSSAGGSFLKKRGRVVSVVKTTGPFGPLHVSEWLVPMSEWLDFLKKHHAAFVGGYERPYPRNRTSYLVLVDQGERKHHAHGRPVNRKAKIYHPRTNALKAVN